MPKNNPNQHYKLTENTKTSPALETLYQIQATCDIPSSGVEKTEEAAAV